MLLAGIDMRYPFAPFVERTNQLALPDWHRKYMRGYGLLRW